MAILNTANSNRHNTSVVTIGVITSTINTTSDISIPIGAETLIGAGNIQPKWISIKSTSPQRR